jgi:transposase
VPSRRHFYPSSLTEAQWQVLEPVLPPPGNTGGKGGRAEKWARRLVLDAIFYLVRGGIAWRALPADFPPHQTAYGLFARWRDAGAWCQIHAALRDQARTRAGRDHRPAAAVIDFQTNNADFRGTDENLQQVAIARMRAIETGRSVVNLSTTGTSQVIAPDGSTLQTLPFDEAGLMVAEIELRDGLTAGVMLGPWIQGLVLWGTLASLGVLAVRARRPGL